MSLIYCLFILICCCIFVQSQTSSAASLLHIYSNSDWSATELICCILLQALSLSCVVWILDITVNRLLSFSVLYIYIYIFFFTNGRFLSWLRKHPYQCHPGKAGSVSCSVMFVWILTPLVKFLQSWLVKSWNHVQ